MTPDWQPFDQEKWDQQPLPPERRMVLLKLSSTDSLPRGAAVVGYLRYVAGDPQSPMFVHPGHVAQGAAVAYWADCLGDDFVVPDWQMTNKR